MHLPTPREIEIRKFINTAFGCYVTDIEALKYDQNLIRFQLFVTFGCLIIANIGIYFMIVAFFNGVELFSYLNITVVSVIYTHLISNIIRFYSKYKINKEKMYIAFLQG